MTLNTASVALVACLSICTMLRAVPAAAQDPIETAVAHVGLGVGINFIDPASANGKTSNGIAVAYRWHSFHSGWGPTFGLDWHTTDFTQSRGGVDVPLGSLRMRAYLAGIGHTQRLGRFTTSASVSGGYSFNHLSTDSGMAPAFASTGVSLVGVSVKDSAMFKPEVSLWYDVFRHAGVGVSAAYLVSRPKEVVTTAAGSEVRHLNTDAWELTASVTFGVWKKRAQ